MASGYYTGRGSVHWVLEYVVTLDAQAALQLTETTNPLWSYCFTQRDVFIITGHTVDRRWR